MFYDNLHGRIDKGITIFFRSPITRAGGIFQFSLVNSQKQWGEGGSSDQL